MRDDARLTALGDVRTDAENLVESLEAAAEVCNETQALRLRGFAQVVEVIRNEAHRTIGSLTG